MLSDVLGYFITSVDQRLLALALLLTFLISVKRWFIDYFLLNIEGLAIWPQRQQSIREMAHFSYVQGISTATLSIFWFGMTEISIKLGLLDALICMLFYLARDSLQVARPTGCQTCLLLRRIFLTEALRFAGLVVLITIMFFESRITSIELMAGLIASNLSSMFDIAVGEERFLRSTMFTVSLFLAFSFVCNILHHMRLVDPGKFSANNLLILAFTCFLLYFTTTHSTLASLVLSACVASTYYYARVIACSLKPALSSRSNLLVNAAFYTGMFLLALANGLLYYSLIR
jgi:hypothetical protein